MLGYEAAITQIPVPKAAAPPCGHPATTGPYRKHRPPHRIVVVGISKTKPRWLIGDVVAGLNNADRFERFYDALSKIGEEFHLDYDYTIDRWLHIPDKEEWPTCWK